jgi:hypothetical protein
MSTKFLEEIFARLRGACWLRDEFAALDSSELVVRLSSLQKFLTLRARACQASLSLPESFMQRCRRSHMPLGHLMHCISEIRKWASYKCLESHSGLVTDATLDIRTESAMPITNDDPLLPFSLRIIFQKKVTAAFDGGRISADGGVLVLAGADKRLARALRWPRSSPALAPYGSRISAE